MNFVRTVDNSQCSHKGKEVGKGGILTNTSTAVDLNAKIKKILHDSRHQYLVFVEMSGGVRTSVGTFTMAISFCEPFGPTSSMRRDAARTEMRADHKLTE